MTPTEHIVPARAGRREWIGLGVLALACLVYSMDLTVLNLAVPALSEDLQPTSTQLLWIVDIYGFMVAGSLITMGTLGDRIGRRRLLMLGGAFFAVASVISAFSTSAEMLIASRALLGLAGATLAPSTLSLIRHMFLDDKQRTVAIGVWITAFSAGAAVGPVAGGVLLEFFWWGSVFLLALPVMALLLILGPRLLPEYKDPDAGRLDLVSAALSLFAVLGLIYGLKRWAQDGMDGVAAATMVGGVALGVLFVVRQRRLADPLIDIDLFRRPKFSASLMTYSVGVLVLGGSFLFMAQYLQLVKGLSPLVAGLWMLPSTMGFVVGAMLAPPLVAHVRPAIVMGAGMLAGAVGLGMITLVGVDSGFGYLIGGSILFSLGLAPVFTLATDLIVGSAPPEKAGAASGISETGAEFGGALGIAVLGSIGTAIYRAQMADGIPDGVAAGAADVARDTLGGALAVSEELPEAVGGALLGSGYEALTQALQVTSAVSAVLALIAAVIATVFLWRVRMGSEPEPEPARPTAAHAALAADRA